MSDERIRLFVYDEDWPRLFAKERLLLQRVLARWLAGGVHHVGSTSIPAIAAKPCIDMIAGVRNFEEARGAFELLKSEGYVESPHRAGIAHHFYKPTTRQPDGWFGLHLTEPGSDLWRERLAFRDALQHSPALARKYEQLKLRLAAEHPNDLSHIHTESARSSSQS